MNATPILLVIPPLTQLNTPYPSTAYLTGFLRSRGFAVHQADIGIEMVLALFSRPGLQQVFEQVRARLDEIPGEARQLLALERSYLDSIEPVISFLQGRDPALAPLICQGKVLPEGPRFAARVRSRAWARVPTTDRATHLARVRPGTHHCAKGPNVEVLLTHLRPTLVDFAPLRLAF